MWLFLRRAFIQLGDRPDARHRRRVRRRQDLRERAAAGPDERPRSGHDRVDRGAAGRRVAGRVRVAGAPSHAARSAGRPAAGVATPRSVFPIAKQPTLDLLVDGVDSLPGSRRWTASVATTRPGRSNPDARSRTSFRGVSAIASRLQRRVAVAMGSDGGDRDCGRGPSPWSHRRAARNGTGVAVEDRTAGAHETVRYRFTANRRGLTPPAGLRAYVHSREDGAANSCVMQTLDNHDLDVIVQVRKFGEGFDHPFLECCP